MGDDGLQGKAGSKSLKSHGISPSWVRGFFLWRVKAEGNWRRI